MRRRHVCICKTKNSQLVRQQGFFLLEMMMAVSIGLIILSILIEIFLICQHSLQTQSALREIQSNAFAAAQIIRSEIHKAGQVGCARLSDNFPVISFQSIAFNGRNKFTGKSANQFVVRYAEFPSAILAEPMQTYDEIIANTDMQFDPGDTVIISNCQRAELFQIRKVILNHGVQTISASSPLHHLYENHAEISRFIMRTYSIENSGRVDVNKRPVYSLYVEEMGHPKAELVSGINAMKLRYTVRHNDVLMDLPAEVITNWEEVSGVNVTLELSSMAIKKQWQVYAAIRQVV